MGLRRKQVPGCWAVTVLLGSLDLGFCRKEKRLSGFRKSLIRMLGSWGPALKQASSDGPARPVGIVTGRPRPLTGSPDL